MNKKKIQFITSYPLNIEPVIRNRLTPFIKVAIQKNYDVQVFSTDNSIFEIEGIVFDHVLIPDSTIKPRNFFRRVWFEISQARQLIKAAINHPADYRVITAPSMFLLFNSHLFKKNSFIVDLRDATWNYISSKNPVFFLVKKLFKFLAYTNLRNALFVNVTNNTELKYIREDLKLKNIKVLLIPNGVTKKQFKDLSNTSIDKSTSLTIAYIGNVGIGQNLRYFSDVASRLPGVNFYIVGAGTDYDGIKEYAKKKNASNLIITGRLGWNEVKEIYSKAHVLYAQLSSDFGMAMPSKLYEYLSTGKYVIYGGEDQAKKALAEFDNNIVINPCNLKSLESAIEKLIISKSYLDLSSKNIQRIEKNFIRENSVIKFYDFLNIIN